MKKPIEMEIDKFEKECLQMVDFVYKKKISIVITKDGVPLVMLSPIKDKKLLIGFLKGTVKIKGNIMDPIDEKWDALS